MDNTVQWSLYDIDLGFSGEHFFVWIDLGALYVFDLGFNELDWSLYGIDLGVIVENCFFLFNTIFI